MDKWTSNRHRPAIDGSRKLDTLVDPVNPIWSRALVPFGDPGGGTESGKRGRKKGEEKKPWKRSGEDGDVLGYGGEWDNPGISCASSPEYAMHERCLDNSQHEQ